MIGLWVRVPPSAQFIICIMKKITIEINKIRNLMGLHEDLSNKTIKINNDEYSIDAERKSPIRLFMSIVVIFKASKL